MYFYYVISINIHSICIKPHIKVLPNTTLSQQNKKVQFLLVNQEWSVGVLKLATDKIREPLLSQHNLKVLCWRQTSGM